jgi:hypothetical protein
LQNPNKFSESTVADSDIDRASCKFLMSVYISIIDILAGQSGCFAIGIARRTFGLSFQTIDKPG